MIGDYTTEMIIHNATRDLHDAIVKCEVHNDVGKSEDTETLDITCEYANGVRNENNRLSQTVSLATMGGEGESYRKNYVSTYVAFPRKRSRF